MKIVEDIEKAWADKRYDQLVSYAKRLKDSDFKGLPLHVLSFLGVAAAITNRNKVALRPLWFAHQLFPGDLNARLNLGNCLKDLGDWPGALQVYLGSPEALEDPLITLGAGICLIETGNYLKAEELLRRSLELKQDKVAFLNLGRALYRLERINEAAEAYTNAINLDPRYLRAAVNLSICAVKSGAFEQAISLGDQVLSSGFRDDRFLKTMLTASLEMGAPRVGLHFFDQYGDKSDAQTQFVAAEAHRFLKNLGRASELCREVVKRDKNYFSAFVIMAHSLAEQGRLEDAENAVTAAFSGRKIDDIAPQYLPNPWTIFSLRDDPALQLKMAKKYSDATYNRLPRNRGVTGSGGSNKRVIAYLSPDFGAHPVTECMLPVFQSHSRDSFEIHAFSLRPRPDAMTEEVAASVDVFHDCHKMQYSQLRDLAKSAEIDILIDLAVFTSSGRPNFTALGLAPVQINHLGYSGTSGAAGYDYIIGDRFIIPEGSEGFYSEHIIRLDLPLLSSGLRDYDHLKPKPRGEFGIREESIVFGCLANPYKFTGELLRSWAAILASVENSVLLLGRMEDEVFETIRGQLQKFGADRGRVFASGYQATKEDHISRLKVVDVFLDTYPYNAHSLAADSFSAAVPVVSRVGKAFASRVAGSLNDHFGLGELNAGSAGEYVEKAVALGMDAGRRREISRIMSEAVKRTVWGASYASDFEEKMLRLG